MKNYIKGTLSDGTLIFNGTLGLVPRKDEEIDVNGIVYIVKNVRHVLKEGLSNNNYILLILKPIE